VVRKSARRTWKHLAGERIRDVSPTIPMGENSGRCRTPKNVGVKNLFAARKLRDLATSLRSRDDDAEVEAVDAADWMKGCSSLGLLRKASRPASTWISIATFCVLFIQRPFSEYPAGSAAMQSECVRSNDWISW
jgi:hypothetical protein